MLLILSIVIPLVIGGILVFVGGRLQIPNVHGETHCITGIEYGVVAPIIALIAFVVVAVLGPNMAKANAAAGYKQFLNGSVTRAVQEETPCTRDGPCVYEYQCDPYQDTETYTETETYTGADGKTATRTVTKTRQVTKYHDCPEVTSEYSYFLETNLGHTITVASHIFAANPQRWRSGEQISSSVPRGEPERWVIARQRLETGDTEPVTVVNDYTNFILPSEGTLYDKYSDSIEGYRKAGMLPQHTQNLGDNVLFDAVPQARKVQFVGGLPPAGLDTWQDRLMRFNAALGPRFQGDLHIVALPAGAVSNPRDYLNALVAHWQSDLGKWGFPKNGIALVIGVGNGGMIEWSEAKTGMPEGNGSMLSAMNLNLKGERFDPDTLLGKVTVSPLIDDKGNLKVDEGGDPQMGITGSDGQLGQIMFRDHPFKRACMKCGDKDDNGTGYVFLKDSIPIPTGAKVLWIFIVIGISSVLWALAFFFDPASFIRNNRNTSGTGSSSSGFSSSGSQPRSPFRTGRF